MTWVRINPPEVEVIGNGHSTMVVPLLEDGWSDLMKLAWKAAVVELETGVRVRVSRYRPIIGPGYYSLSVGLASTSGLDMGRAWDVLNGVLLGGFAWAKTKPTSAEQLQS